MLTKQIAGILFNYSIKYLKNKKIVEIIFPALLLYHKIINFHSWLCGKFLRSFTHC